MDISVATVYIVPILFFAGLWGLKTYRKRVRLAEALHSDLPAEYESRLKNFVPYTHFSDEEKRRFKTKLILFMREKTFLGVGDFQVTEDMKYFIAAEACLMITNLPGGVYEGLSTIYITADAFIPKDNPVNPATGLPTHTARLGEAWKNGPIVLSWDSVSRGSSVVFHEFTHQLDQQDGGFDGTPVLGRKSNYQQWAQVMGSEFMHLRSEVQKHHHTDIDPYGATNEAEFFAVVSEHFFTRPSDLVQRHPQLYELYKNFFKLDPLLWERGH